MPREVTSHPTEVELHILRVLWEQGKSTAREIHSRLNAERDRNYSTTVKMLAVMLHKGLVKRDEQAQPHRYWPAQTRARTGRQMLQQLIDKVYAGSATSLVLQALSTGKATPAERDEIRRLLDHLEEDRS